jgi:hypothetical protein
MAIGYFVVPVTMNTILIHEAFMWGLDIMSMMFTVPLD